MSTGKLTALSVRNAKGREKVYRLADGAGLYLEVHPSGSRYWRLKYRHDGKEKRLALGVFPEVSLVDARAERDEARKHIAAHRDPAVERKLAKARDRLSAANTFGAIADEWLEKNRAALAPATLRKVEWQFDLAKPLSSRPLAEVTPPEILDLLRTVEKAGNRDSAHRLKQRVSQIFRYAVATGRAVRDLNTHIAAP